jgi:hypothetical protein
MSVLPWLKEEICVWLDIPANLLTWAAADQFLIEGFYYGKG